MYRTVCLRPNSSNCGSYIESGSTPAILRMRGVLICRNPFLSNSTGWNPHSIVQRFSHETLY